MEIGAKGSGTAGICLFPFGKQVHPLALGNVQRNYALIRSIARKLLRLHMSAENEI